MGAKYVPSIKDQRANARFAQKQHVQSKFIKPPGKPAPAAAKPARPPRDAGAR